MNISLRTDISREELDLTKGKFEQKIVEPYLPNKIIPPEYIRDILNEADQDFPSIDFEIEVPHKWRTEEYKKKYEELESQMMEILSWRTRWFGKTEKDKK
jgi:hypothetical protein